MAVFARLPYKRSKREGADMEIRQHLMILGIGVTMVGVLATAQPVDAQAKEARGTITAVTDSTISIKAGAQEMTFFVDSRTHLEVRTAQRDLQKAQPGGPSPRVNSFFETGQVVLIRFEEEKGRNHALDISRVGSTGGGGGSVSNPDKISEGKVKAVTASQLIIDAGGRDMTFAITGNTNVLAKGASTATKAAGGSTAITTFVHMGDSVSVSYKDEGGKMVASEVRVRVAAK
jgi:hypothetical protein